MDTLNISIEKQLDCNGNDGRHTFNPREIDDEIETGLRTNESHERSSDFPHSLRMEDSIHSFLSHDDEHNEILTRLRFSKFI